MKKLIILKICFADYSFDLRTMDYYTKRCPLSVRDKYKDSKYILREIQEPALACITGVIERSERFFM